MGARICPGCATRVDERRAKTSPFCLRCGAPLGPPSPVEGGRSGTFGGKPPAVGTGSALPWILGGIAVVVVLGLVGVVALLALVSTSASPDPAPATTIGTPPKIEAPPTATPSAPGTATSVKVTVPTVRTTATSAQTFTTRPTSTPTIPIPTPPPTATPSAPVVLAAFNRNRAQGEVDRVGATLASCARSAGPFGPGSIRVDFEPDGRVGTLSRPPFAGTATGSCISARFLAIRIGPFTGSTQNIDKAFIIQQQ